MRLRGVLTVLAAVVGSVGVIAAPAQALSCAAWETTDPAELVAGAPLREGRPLFDFYDYAVVGTVVERRGDTGPQPREVTVSVETAFGIGSVAPSVVVRQHQTWGWDFAEGERFFIPVTSAYDLTQCDPVIPVSAVQADELIERAGDAGTLMSSPVLDPMLVVSDELVAGADSPMQLMAWGAVVLIGGGLLAWYLRGQPGRRED